MKKRKRLFKNAIVYALVAMMVVTTIPLQAFASDDNYEVTETEITESAPAEEVIPEVTQEVIEEVIPEETNDNGDDAIVNENENGNTEEENIEVPIETPAEIVETPTEGNNDDSVNPEAKDEEEILADGEEETGEELPIEEEDLGLVTAKPRMMMKAGPGPEPKVHNIKVTEVAGEGTYTCPATAKEGETFEVTATPASGYEFTSIQYKVAKAGPNAVFQKSYTSPTSIKMEKDDVEILIVFTKIPPRTIKNITLQGVSEPLVTAYTAREASDTGFIGVSIDIPNEYGRSEKITDFEVNDIKWQEGSHQMRPSDEFKENTTYKVHVKLTFTGDYYISDSASATISGQGAEFKKENDKTCIISKTYTTPSNAKPNVTLNKGSNFPTSLPNTVKAGSIIDLRLQMFNTGSASLDYNTYNDGGFTILDGNKNATGETIICDNVRKICDPGSDNNTFTYKLAITNADIAAGKVVRTIKTVGTIRDPETGGTQNLKYTNTPDLIIELPIEAGGDLGYIEAVNVITPNLVIGEMLPTDLSLFKTDDSRCYVSNVEWLNGTRVVEGDTEYSVTMTVNIANGYNGIFKKPCDMTANGGKADYANRYNDTTLYIRAKIKSPVGTYNLKKEISPANSGTLTFSKDTFNYGDKVTIIAKANDGYVFDYITINGITYTDSTFVYTCNSYKDITVNAYFKAKSICTVDFDANGGRGTMEPITGIEKGNRINTPECKFTREGYEFDHWELPSGAAINLSTFVVDESMTLKAIWKQVTKYEIVFSTDHQRSTGAMNNVRVDNGATYTVPEPTGFTAYDGYEFDYWLLREEGKEDKKVYPNDEIIVTNKIYLNAKWKAVTPVNPEYNLTSDCTNGNIIFKNGDKVVTKAKAGDDITFEIKANDGYAYKADSFKFVGNEPETVYFNFGTDPSGHFKMPACDLKATATFLKLVSEVKITANDPKVGANVSGVNFKQTGCSKIDGYVEILTRSGFSSVPGGSLFKEGQTYAYQMNLNSSAPISETCVVTYNNESVTLFRDETEFNNYLSSFDGTSKMLGGFFNSETIIVFVGYPTLKAAAPVEYNLSSDCTNGNIIFKNGDKVVTKAKAGDDITFEIKANDGYAYKADSFKFVGNEPETVYFNFGTDPSGHFKMPACDLKATATFLKLVSEVKITANDPVIGEDAMNVKFNQTGADKIEGLIGIFDASGMRPYTGIFKEDDIYLYEIVLESKNGFSNDCTFTYNDKAATIFANEHEYSNKIENYDGKSLEIVAYNDGKGACVTVCFPALKDTKPKTCKVTYDIDGSTASFEVEKGSKHTVVDFKEVYKKALLENEEFGVWKDNTGKTYKVGEEITVDSDINLSATIVIKPKYEFRVSADPSNTECISKGYVSANSFIEVPDYTAKLDISKVFYNWVCDGENYYPEETVCVEEDMIFYPEIGENRKFEIIVDPENGKPAKIYNLYDGEIFIAPEYEWTAPKGKKFDHWVLLPAQPVFRLAIIPGYGAVDVKPGEEIKVTKAFTLSASFVDLPDDPKPDDPKPNDPKPNDPKPNDPKPEDPKPNTAPASKNEAVVTPAKEVKQPNADDLPQTGGPQTSLAIPLTIGSTLVLAGFSIFFASKKRKNKS